MLDLAKIESGKMDLLPETFDVAGMIQDVVTTIQPLAQKNANVLEVHCPADLGTHARRLDQGPPEPVQPALQRLQVHREGDHPPGGSPATEEGRDWVTFQVTDTGIGIDPGADGPAVRAVLPGGPLDHAPQVRRDRPGAGDHPPLLPGDGGRHRGREHAGRGLHLHHPAAGAGPPLGSHRPDAAAPERRPGRTLTVLVIDDDPASRDLVTRFLGEEGFRVETAADGEEGLLRARQVRPVVITLDVVMPGKDGWAVLSALKADPELADIPVIMLTVVDEQNEAYTLGASDYLTKPINWTASARSSRNTGAAARAARP